MTGSNSETERLSAALRSLGNEARPTADCPPGDRIWQAVRLELALEDRLRIIDHTATCPVCAEAWRLAMAANTSLRAADATKTSIPRRYGRWLAAAVILVAAGTTLMLVRSNPFPEERNPPAPTIQSELPEGVAYARDDVRLRWTAGPPGSRYDVSVTTPDLQVIATVQGLERSQYHVPPERLASVPSGTQLLWRVVARPPDGTTSASRTFQVTVR